MKYKQDGKKEVSSSLYHQLPATTETQLAKELRDICSEVRDTETQSECESVPAVCQLFKVSVCVCVQVKYKEEGKKEISKNLYSLLPETAETQFAKQMSEIQSEVRTLNAPHRCIVSSDLRGSVSVRNLQFAALILLLVL